MDHIWIIIAIVAGALVLLTSILTGIFVLYVLSTKCRKGQSGMRKFRSWAYAHRGLHNDTRPENSMAAFRAAVNAGYGIELDVHLLKDGNLAVIHDHSLLRTTGAEGKIEDLSTEDLWEYHLQGTSETIPTLREVLEMVGNRVPLIIELKADGKNHAHLTRTVCEMLDHYSGMYCLESFDPRCIRWLKTNRPELIRGQLVEDSLKRKVKKVPYILRFCITRQLFNFLLQPDFVAYRFEDRRRFGNMLVKKLWGAMRVTWTVQNIDDYLTAKDEGWVIIFEGFTP